MAEIWKPFPVQEKALTRTEFELLFGGSRGPGKTDTGQVWLLGPEYAPNKPYITHPRYRALVLRKNANDLTDWLDRAARMYKRFGAVVKGNPPVIAWPSGAIFRTGHLKDRKSYENFLGHEYQRILIEELTQIPKEEYYLQILGSCRSTVEELKPKVFCTTNPGGIGHAWVKQRFVDISPWGEPYHYTIQTDGQEITRSRIFIHATIDDNPILKEKDPGYIAYLEELKEKNPELYKAWRYGEWEIFAGQALHEWRKENHVIDRLPIPLEACKKVIGFDRGYNAPGAAVWLAFTPRDRFGVRYAIQYRELYQDRMSPEEWARKIKTYVSLEKTAYMVLPHDCYAEVDGRPSYASIFTHTFGTLCPIRRGNTLAARARQQRLGILHDWLADVPGENPHPRLQVLSRCTDTIRTLPELVIDENDVEDINTDGEDHLYDALTTVLMTEAGNEATSHIITAKTPGSSIVRPVWNVRSDGKLALDDLQKKVAQATSKPNLKKRRT